MARRFQVGSDALGDIRVDGESVASAAFSDDAQRVEAAVLVKIFHGECGDFRAAESNLQAHGENRAVAQAFDRVFRRGVEQLCGIGLGECECRSFPPVDGGAFHLGNRVEIHMVVALEMLEQARQCREPAPDGGRGGVLGFAHDALPGDDGAVVHLAQFVVGRDVKRAHEMLHVELVGAAGALAFLLGEPDVFLGDVGKLGDGR